MKLGISTAVFYPIEPEKTLDIIAALGFNQVEVFLNSEFEFSKDYILDFKKKLDELNLKAISLHPYTSVMEAIYFFSGYRRRFDDALELYTKYFRAAAILGAEYFTFHGDRALHASSYVSIDDSLIERNGKVLKTLWTRARECGITLCQENVSWCKSRDLNYLAALKSYLGRDMAFTLDIKQARRVDKDPGSYIDVMGSAIRCVHLSDYCADNPCILPGHGTANFKRLFQRLDEVGCKNNIILEVYSDCFSNYDEIGKAKEFVEVLL